MDVPGEIFDGPARRQRPGRKTAEIDLPVVHQDGPGDAHIDAEAGRDFDRIGTALEDVTGQLAPLRPQNVGRLAGMTEAGQRRRLVQQLHAHQIAPLRQQQRCGIRKAVERHVARRVRCIGPAAVAALIDRADGEHERRPESMGGAEQTAHIHRLGNALDADPEIAAHTLSLTNAAR